MSSGWQHQPRKWCYNKNFYLCHDRLGPITQPFKKAWWCYDPKHNKQKYINKNFIHDSHFYKAIKLLLSLAHQHTNIKLRKSDVGIFPKFLLSVQAPQRHTAHHPWSWLKPQWTAWHGGGQTWVHLPGSPQPFPAGTKWNEGDWRHKNATDSENKRIFTEKLREIGSQETWPAGRCEFWLKEKIVVCCA